MNSRRNLLLSIGALAVMLIGFIALRSATRDMARDRIERTVKDVKEKSKDELLEAIGNASAAGAEMSGTDDQGRPLWSVGAEKSQIRTEENGTSHVTLTNARATLYKEGQPQSRFRGAKMELTRTPDEKVRLALSGGVTATTTVPQGTKNLDGGSVVLTTPRANVDVTTRRLVADGGITLTQGKGDKAIKITAPRLNADAGLAIAQVAGGVVATAPQGTLRAAEATWNWQSGRVAASGGVTAQHDDTTLTGARLDADIDGKSGTLSGGVTARSAKGSARGGSVSYNWAAGRLVASGGVTLTQGDASLRAARIDTDDKLQNAVASGGVTLAKDGVRLLAARAEATQGLSRASASGGVTITKDDVTVRAARVDSFDNFARATAQGAVTLTKGLMTLRAGNIQVLDRATRAVATSGVTLRQGDLTVTAARADATNLGNQSALRVVASGGVTARNSGGTVRAANVTWANNRVVATGGVRAQRDKLNLSANRFESDDAGKKAVLTGNVVVRHPNGASLHAPRARYDKAANKVWAEGGIQFRDAGGGLLRAKTLVANLDLKQVKITEVDGTVSVETLEGKDLF